MRALLLACTLTLAACETAESSAPAADTALPASDATSEDSAALDVVEDTMAKACPSPLYPPRTDGCPCFPPTGGDCYELGKVCEYYAKCPHILSRYTCKYVVPKEGPMGYKWVASQDYCPDARPTDASSGETD